RQAARGKQAPRGGARKGGKDQEDRGRRGGKPAAAEAAAEPEAAPQAQAQEPERGGRPERQGRTGGDRNGRSRPGRRRPDGRGAAEEAQAPASQVVVRGSRGGER